jgi:hypothetical protein
MKLQFQEFAVALGWTAVANFNSVEKISGRQK